MNAGNVSPTTWQQLYRYAMLETNPTRIPELIAEARAAICERIRDLNSSLPGSEQRTLKDALRFLHILQEEILREGKAA